MEEFLPCIEAKFISEYSSEAEYRADTSAWNYSKLKDFCKSPLRVWRDKYINGNDSFTTSVAMDLGSLIDCRLFEPDLVEEKFCISSANTPSPSYERFIDNLIELVSRNEGLVEEGYFELAYNMSGIKKPLFPRFIEDFIGSEAEVYFNEKLNSLGKITLGLKEYEASERCVNMLLNSDSTKELFRGERINQLAIKFEFEGRFYRCMLDLVVIEHKDKKIKPYDLKTTETDVNDFLYHWFKMKYHIQQSLYTKAIISWGKENYPDYEVEPFRFIVQDSTGFSEPLVYEIAFPETEDDMTGFIYKDKFYKGPSTIIDEIEYHIKTDNWDMRKDNKLNNGQIKIKL